MNKTLKYYMNLNYPVEIIKIPKEEGGGYQARIPLLGKYAFLGDGDSIEEAIKDLEQIKEYLFRKYLDGNIPIPEPAEEKDDREYSGRFVLRIPKELHRHLAEESKKNDSTLNQYCLFLLTRKSFLNTIQEEITEIKSEIKSVFRHIKEIDYKIDRTDRNYKAECFHEINVDFRKCA